MTALSSLQLIKDSLAQEGDPLQVIETCRPHFITDAISWARHLPAWDDYTGHFTPQVMGIARVISKRAMTEFNLEFDDCGRVREKPPTTGTRCHKQGEIQTFTLTINEQLVKVRYTKKYFPNDDQFCFLGAGDPPDPHPLSNSGYHSHLVQAEAVAACGGPEAYATRYAEAKIKGEAKAFQDVFEGKRLEPMKRQPKKPAAEAHAEVISEQPRQGMLF